MLGDVLEVRHEGQILPGTQQIGPKEKPVLEFLVRKRSGMERSLRKTNGKKRKGKRRKGR